MDSNRFKRPNKNRSTSVDGFLGPRPQSDNNRFAPHRNRTGVTRGRLDDFNRRDGFHSVTKEGLGTRRVDNERRPLRDDSGKIKTAAESKKTVKALPKRHGRFGGRRVFTKMLTTVFLLSIVSVGYMFGKAFLSAQQTFGGGAQALEDNIERDGRINVLLLGRGGDGHTAPDLTDTIVIASIDPINNEAALVSVPRDLYVAAGPYGGYTKINAIYANAKNLALSEGSDEERASDVGLKEVTKEVSEVTGVPIHYHVMVDFKGFERAIDVVGGVAANVPEELAVYEIMSINGRAYELNVPAGRQQFDGFRALAFSRTRMTSARGDFDRSERQRLILLALKDKVLSVGTFANPVKVTQLLDTLGGHVRTNLSGLDELARLYELGSDITSDKVKSIGLVDPPNDFLTTSNIGGLSVVIPRAGLDDYSEIQEFLQQELRDGYLKKENAPITVLNGTITPGLATRRAAELKAAGFTINTIDDAPSKDFQATVIVDLKPEENAKTREYLEERFGLAVTTSMPAGMFAPPATDFVIILGNDQQQR